MSRVLIIVDVQNDFCEGGSLQVTESGQIFKFINVLKKKSKFFSHVVITKDWHPKGHISFATRHAKQPFISIEINGKEQQLWPDHCVVGSNGVLLSPLLEVDNTEIVIHKGFQIDVDSYSGFCQGPKGNELRDRLNQLKVKQVYVCGLAFDFCVGSTALDAKKFGFDTFVIKEATRSVSKQTEEVMAAKLKQSNIPVISFEVLKDK